MKFVKMHGAGNDFVVIDGAREILAEEDLYAVGRYVCDRRFGIGADGLVIMLPSKVADLRMRVINSDGTEAEMCGNATRCFAKYAFDRGVHTDAGMTIETLAGIKTVRVNTAGGKVQSARVDMGEPILMRSEIPMCTSNGNGGDRVVSEPLDVQGESVAITCVSMGNPHCVTYVDDVENYPVLAVGPQIETHPIFPRKTNVEFIECISPQEVKMRVWERGCGETMACGTGACASVVASVLNGKVGRSVTVHLRGGDLLIEWGDDNRVYMTGPAEDVFEGEVYAEELKKWTSKGV